MRFRTRTGAGSCGARAFDDHRRVAGRAAGGKSTNRRHRGHYQRHCLCLGPFRDVDCLGFGHTQITAPIQTDLMTRLSSTHAYYLMWLVIVLVSAHDGCLVVVNRPIMRSMEQNPLGHWLIRVWGDDIWLFLALKALGTVSVASVLLL